DRGKRQRNERTRRAFASLVLGAGIVLYVLEPSYVIARTLLTKQLTPTAPSEWRPGTYDRDCDVTGLLQYDTDRVLDLPRAHSRITAGKAADRTLVLEGDYISAHHFVMTRRARGLIVTDDGSKNGLAV